MTMGDVQIVASVPSADGTATAATGSYMFTPTARRSVAGVQILPKPFQVDLVGGAADLVLAENDATWLWRVDEYVTGIASRTIYVFIPTSPVKYADLVALDPASMSPAPNLAPPWAAFAATPDPANPGFYLIGTP